VAAQASTALARVAATAPLVVSKMPVVLVPVKPSDRGDGDGDYQRRWHAAFPVMMQIGSGYFAMLVIKEVSAATVVSVHPSIVSACAWITLVLGGMPLCLNIFWGRWGLIGGSLVVLSLCFFLSFFLSFSLSPSLCATRNFFRFEIHFICI
jgi:hypothetical protein